LKRFLTCLFFFITPALSWADRPLVQEFNDFSPGVDTQHLPTRIKGLQNARNFRTDQNFGLQRRLGFLNETAGCTFSTASALHVWQFTDSTNNDWFIRLDSNGWINAASGLGRSNTCLTTVVTGQFSISAETDADVGLGKFWLTNKTNGLWSWDGTTMVSYTNAPFAARVSVYKNRVILSDISNEQSSIRLSGELNGADWSNDSRFSTSPISIRIGGVNDGYKVYDFFPGLGEGLIFKAGNLGGMYRLLGNDQRDFRVEQITPEIGTIYPNTIAQRGYATIFLSNRGIDSYTPPYTFTPIGTPIQNLVDPLARQSSLSNSRIMDTAGEWNTGFSSPSSNGNVNISTYIITGDIAPNTHQFIDTAEGDWSLGQSSNTDSILSTTTPSGSLTFISTAVPIFLNASFETAGVVSTSALNWSVIGTSGTNGGCTADYPTRREDLNAVEGKPPFDGTYTMTLHREWVDGLGIPIQSTSTFLTITDVNDNVLLTQTYAVNVAAVWTKRTLDTSAFRGRFGKVKVGMSMFALGYGLGVEGLNTSTITSLNIYIGTSVVIQDRVDNLGNGCIPGANKYSILSVDLAYAGIGRTPNDMKASFVSQTFDTRVSSPSYDPFRTSANVLTVASGTVTFGIQTSSADNNCCWSNSINVSTTNPTITNNANRYIRYVSTFATNLTSTESVIIQIDSVTLGSYATGYFRTSAIDLGAGVSSWGQFTAADNNGGDGSISYETQSNSVPSFVESAWAPTTLNTVPSMAANRYAFARMTFQTKAATTTPFVDNITFNWNIGAGNPKPFANTYRESYYLFFSTNISNITNNDVIAVYNRDNVFNTFYGSTLSAAVVYNNTLMMGDYNGTGAVYSMDKSVDGSDAGRPMESYFTIRRLDGDEPDADKIFDRIYMTISRENVSASQIFKMEYAVDASTTWYRAENIEISTGTAIQSKMSSFNSESLVQGHYIDIKVTELTTGNIPYTIERLKLYGTIKEIP
jgi:hypothetical protein